LAARKSFRRFYTSARAKAQYDLRFAVTLWNLAEKKKDLPAAKAAQDFLEGINKQIRSARSSGPRRDRRRSIPRAVYQILEGVVEIGSAGSPGRAKRSEPI